MRSSLKIRILSLLVLFLGATASGCLYTVPIQQGNVITVEMLQELELGMDKRKVRFILGTPLVTDAFHQDRWDYYYSYKHGFGDAVTQSASLYFEGDRLVRINADIDSQIDFHTVTDASENVVVVPRKKKGGFFAAVTPAFVEREEEEQREEAIARALDTGFNEPQPGSGASGAESEVLDPVPAVIGPGLGDAGTPSELYLPNSPTDAEPAGAWSTEPVVPVETVSSETRNQSQYLENLFEDFNAKQASAATTSEEPAPAAASVVTGTSSEPQLTRD